jgi:hypothetical protein
MARASFSILRRYPRLIVFPIISGTVFLIVTGLIVASLMPQLGPLHRIAAPFWDRLDGDGQPWFYIGAFAGLYALTAIALFCNAALLHCALRCHAGEQPSVRAGFAAARARMPQILGWALVATTVGVILNAIENGLKNNLGIFGSLIGGLFEFGWAAASYFVLPVLVVEGVGPIGAFRRASALLRSNWGESLAGETRFGLLGLLFGLQAVAIFFAGLAIVLSSGAAALAGLGPLLMTLGVIYGVATLVVLQTLGTIFQAGVYLYASTGQVPPTFDPALVAGSFRSKG